MSGLDGVTETIFVDDGSSDTSSIILRAKAKGDQRYRFIGLSRNFGHQIAITAGMDVAQGDAVIVMDADLQDPPEVVGLMIEKWKEGFEVVYGRRLSREGESAFKQWTASLFYKILGRLSTVNIPRDAGDFRLIDRFVRGMFAWLGFRQAEVAFHRLPRLAGETKYPFIKMLRLAANGVVGFSDAPLRLAIWAGFAVSAFAALYAIYVGMHWLMGDKSLVAGWASTIVIVSFLSGINMILTGIMGLYVGRIYAEVKRRPLYIVSEKVGFGAEQSGNARETAGITKSAG
jgi:dolichol-phosphate mannosyltransferase